MFSNNLVQPLNSLNQTKKYINNPLFSSFFLNRNLWVSTKVSDNADLQLLNLSDHSITSSSELTTSKGGKVTQLGLNFMEDSVLWNLNRFTNYQNMQCMQHVTTSFASSAGATLKFVEEGFLPTDAKLTLADYQFVLSSLYPALINGYAPTTCSVPAEHLGGSSGSLLLNHLTLELIEVSFVSTSNSANKLIFFSNV